MHIKDKDSKKHSGSLRRQVLYPTELRAQANKHKSIRVLRNGKPTLAHHSYQARSRVKGKLMRVASELGGAGRAATRRATLKSGRCRQIYFALDNLG